MKETTTHGLWYVICVSVHVAKASWTTSMDHLIYSNDQMSIGVYNDTIWLIGGGDFPTQLTQYNVRTQTMTDFGENALTASIKGYGQYWTQQNHMVYIIDQSTGNSLCTYNMITNQFQTNWKSITFNTNVGDDGCLASDAQYLYVTGGEDGNALGLKTLQMLSLSTHQWTTSPPNMNVGRKYHACIVHNTYLWAMGGTGCTYNCPNALTSIERIVVTDIMNNKWNIVSNLPVPLYSLRVIDWYDTLYVLGGYSLINNMMGKVDSVYLIDVDSGDVSLSPYSLPSECAWVSPVIHDSILYIFGGMSRVWAYYQLPQYTSQPTGTPTYAPSKTTLFPSYTPTDMPSDSPTDSPTDTVIPTTSTLEEAITSTISSTSNENIYSSESDHEPLVHEDGIEFEGAWLLIASIIGGCVLCVAQLNVVLYCVRKKRNDSEEMMQKSMEETEPGPGVEDQDMNNVHHIQEFVAPEEIVFDENEKGENNMNVMIQSIINSTNQRMEASEERDASMKSDSADLDGCTNGENENTQYEGVVQGVGSV
eukprot:158919_1